MLSGVAIAVLVKRISGSEAARRRVALAKGSVRPLLATRSPVELQRSGSRPLSATSLLARSWTFPSSKRAPAPSPARRSAAHRLVPFALLPPLQSRCPSPVITQLFATPPQSVRIQIPLGGRGGATANGSALLPRNPASPSAGRVELPSSSTRLHSPIVRGSVATASSTLMIYEGGSEQTHRRASKPRPASKPAPLTAQPMLINHMFLKSERNLHITASVDLPGIKSSQSRKQAPRARDRRSALAWATLLQEKKGWLSRRKLHLGFFITDISSRAS